PLGLTKGTGFVGAGTRTQLNTLLATGTTTTPVSNLPAGCTSTSGFSPVTGQACSTVSTLPTGCTSTTGFSPVTGQSCAGGTTTPVVTPVTGSGMTVALASDSPSNTTLVTGQAIAPLAKFVLTNSDSVTATITKVELQRLGVSADTTLSNVYLFNGTTRLTDAATISQGKVTFNSPSGVITIPAGQSVVVTVVSDIDATTSTSGQTVGVSLIGLTSNVEVKSTLPLNGGIQTIASANLAAVALTSVLPTATGLKVNAGTSDYTIFSTILTVTNRNVNLSGVTLKQIGSIPTDALENIQLYVNGIAVGSSIALSSDGTARFVLATPYEIKSGDTLEVRANVVKGSSRLFSFSLQNASDLVLTDSVYNVNVVATGIPANTSSVTINEGSVSVTTDSTFNTTSITTGTSNATLAKYNFKAYGEDVKVSYLNVVPSTPMDNVVVYVNGSPVTSNQNYTSGTLQFSLGSSLTIPANTTVSVEVRGDTKVNGVNIPTGPISVSLVRYANNAQGVSSSTLITAPSASITGPTLTIGTGTLTLNTSSSFPNGNIIPNTANQKIGSYVFQSGDSESVRINSINVKVAASNINNLSNLYVKYNGISSQTIPTPQSSNNISVNVELGASQSMVFDVYADTGALASTSSTIAVSAASVTTAGADVGAAATPQVSVLTLVAASGQTYNVTINGTLYSEPGTATVATDATNLATKIAADAAVASAVASGNVITITAKTAGLTGFTISSTPVITTVSTTAGTDQTAAVPNVRSITISGDPVSGDIVKLTIGANSYSVTANSTTLDTAIEIADALAASANGNATFGAVDGGDGIITLTARSAGAAANLVTVTPSVTLIGGSVQTTLSANVTGVASNSTVAVNPKVGQAMVITSPTLQTPTLVASSSPANQYVLAGSQGVIAYYQLAATNGSVTIDEINFTVDNAKAITEIIVEGKSSIITPTTGTTAGTAKISGLNYVIPAGYSGKTLPVTVKFNTVGLYGGAATKDTAKVSISSVKYTAGNLTTTLTPAAVVDSNTMTLAGGMPSVSLAASNRTGLATGSTLLGSVTVGATKDGGAIKVQTLAIKVGLTTATLDGNFSVKVGGSNVTVNATAAAKGEQVITLTDSYGIASGSSVTFDIYANVASADANSSVTTELGAAASFLWTDVEGGTASGLNGTLLPNYSTNVTSVVKNF
ncbi:MAG: hypothetical protein PHR13_11705, partial [Dysgonamonadaceae bacterium]|nr:hypothetical protein [Dysgonamonadaceae bacterium]